MTINDTSTTRRKIGEQLASLAGELDDEELVALQYLVAKAEGTLDLLALEEVPADVLFDEDEISLIEDLDAQPEPEPALPHQPTLIMKSTRLCNLRCTYCNAWAEGRDQQMTFEVLARTIHGLLRDPGVVAPTFVWHGGEPTLRGVEFYVRALWLQQHWGRDHQTIRNQLQTNATRLSPEFLELCKRYRISLSVSLDGPPEIHDRQRLDAAGRPTSARVREGLAAIREAGLDAGVLMVIDQDTVDLGPELVLDHLLELDVPAAGLLNVVPNIDDRGVNPDAPWLPWGTWQQFLGDMFRLWWPEQAQRIHIRELDSLASMAGGTVPHMCHHHGDCFSFAFTVEPNGEIGPCDKYVDDPDGRYGSVMESPLAEVLTSPGVQARRSLDHAEMDTMTSCRWHEVCNGGCPFDRAVNAGRGAAIPDGCCGLGPLLDEVEAMLDDAPVPDAITAAFGDPIAEAPRGVPVMIGRRE